MKYPKLFDGPSPGGESSIRALNRDDRSAPFLTIYGHDFVASKADDYNSVSVKRGEPYFFTFYKYSDTLNEAGVYVTLFYYIVVDTKASTHTKDKINATPKEPGTDFILYSPFMTYVGDGYVLSYLGDLTLDFANQTAYYPILKRAGHLTPSYPAGDTNGKNKTTVFYPFIPILKLWLHEYFINVFPIGYKDSSSRFMFGCSWFYPTVDRPLNAFNTYNAASPAFWTTRCQPRMFVGDTVSRNMHEVSAPLEPGRHMFPLTPTCVGRGKLQYICFVSEEWDLSQPPPNVSGVRSWLPKIDPSLVYSSDFGETWTRTPLTSLLPYMAMEAPWLLGGRYPNNRSIYYHYQFEYCGRYGTMFYAGDGKVWYFMPNGMTAPPTGGPGSDSFPVNSTYHPLLFLGPVGSDNFERVAWPADDWEVSDWGLPRFNYPHPEPPFTYIVGFRIAPTLHCAHFVFGTGCLYVPIVKFDTGQGKKVPNSWEIMFTHDFGATWQYNTSPVPAAVQAIPVAYSSFAGTVIRPYKKDGDVGKLLFVSTDPATLLFEVWETNGNFDKWTRVHKVEGALPSQHFVNDGDVDELNGSHVPQPRYDGALYGVNVGTPQIPASIYPAFPGEFDHG